MTVHAGDRSALLFLDLSDTIDTVVHEIFFSDYRITAAWLTSPTIGFAPTTMVAQVVCTKDEQSGSSAPFTSVPQGAVLGSIAYLIYANPIPSV